MKRVVIDTNIVFSLLLSENSLLRNKFFDDSILIYAPSYLFFEIFSLKEKLLKYSKLDREDFDFLFHRLFDRIIIIGSDYVQDKFKHLAIELCQDIDEKDSPFVALALQFEGTLWTGDNRLKNGLKEIGYDFFYE